MLVPNKHGPKNTAGFTDQKCGGFFIGDLMAVSRCWDDGAEVAKQGGGYYYRLASKP